MIDIQIHFLKNLHIRVWYHTCLYWSFRLDFSTKCISFQCTWLFFCWCQHGWVEQQDLITNRIPINTSGIEVEAAWPDETFQVETLLCPPFIVHAYPSAVPHTALHRLSATSGRGQALDELRAAAAAAGQQKRPKTPLSSECDDENTSLLKVPEG